MQETHIKVWWRLCTGFSIGEMYFLIRAAFFFFFCAFSGSASATGFSSGSTSETFHSGLQISSASLSKAAAELAPLACFNTAAVTNPVRPPRSQKAGFSAIARHNGSSMASKISERLTALSFLLNFNVSSRNAIVSGWNRLLSSGATNHSIILK